MVITLATLFTIARIIAWVIPIIGPWFENWWGKRKETHATQITDNALLVARQVIMGVEEGRKMLKNKYPQIKIQFDEKVSRTMSQEAKDMVTTTKTK